MIAKWWQKAVFYQVYLRSFADGNGDGIGDFIGLTEKLDYLKDLGVDALWLSPHFPSPNWDWGYDISNYCNVAPEFGSLDDFNVFLREAHNRDLHVILDLVLNHTSDEHPWFIESKSSRDNPKSDWYVWCDGPPNNWQSCFDGEAWTYAPERDQYYYHYFMRQQPDLNWRNPQVIDAMWTAVRFWLNLGIDGFRLDAIGTIFEDPQLTPHSVHLDLTSLRYLSSIAKTHEEKEKVNDYWLEMFKYQWNQPGVHTLLKQLRSILDKYSGDRVLVGEDDNPEYMGNGEDELNLVFRFHRIRTDSPLTPAWIRQYQKDRLALLAKISLQAWPCNTLGNHDSSRVYSHYADGTHDADRARQALATILTLKGTPFLYYGEEIGMTDYMITDPEKLRDSMAKWWYQRLTYDLNVEPLDAARQVAAMSRDRNRTPMQWSNSANGGFCPGNVQPWLPVNPNFSLQINVRDQHSEPDSLWHFYKMMLQVRKSNPALIEGDYELVHDKSEEYLAFLRKTENQTVLVVLSFSEKRKSLSFSALPYKSAHIIFSSLTRSKLEENLKAIHLGPFEIFIAELQ